MNSEICRYNAAVPRKPRKPNGPRPLQGARLLALRKAAGLNQADLARLVNESQENISFWERSDKPPRSDILPKMAKVLGVSVEALLGEHGINDQPLPLSLAPGPTGQVQRAFEKVRRLPRRQQQKVVEFVLAFVNEYYRKAS